MVSNGHISQLFIYSRDCHFLSTILINDSDELWDATWTPSGKIIYTTFNSKKEVIISESGKVDTTHTQMKLPRHLSVSNAIIYLADWKTGVYQSTNGGLSWNLVLKSTTEGSHCRKVMNMTTDHSDDLWTLEETNASNDRLRVYSVDKRRNNGNPTSKDANISLPDGNQINFVYRDIHTTAT